MNESTPSLHPEIIRLTEENAIFREQLAQLLGECHILVQTVKPNLLAIYQKKIGLWELKLLRMRTEVARCRRTVELAQAAINQGEKPDWVAIEGELELEFLQWKEKIREATEAIKAAESYLTTPLSPQDSNQLKKLYYALVKRLHPDMNPGLDEEQQLLWQRVQEAYERSNLEELKALTLLLEKNSSLPVSVSSLEQLQEEGKLLSGHIMAAIARIEKIKSVPPFTIENDLMDQDWVDARRAEIDRQTAEQTRLRDILLEQLERLRNIPGYGQSFSSN